MKLSRAIKRRLEKAIAKKENQVTHFDKTMFGVKDGVLLNLLDQAKIIKVHDHTNNKVASPISGQTMSAKYIKEVIHHKVENYLFQEYYVDGCFYASLNNSNSVRKAFMTSYKNCI